MKSPKSPKKEMWMQSLKVYVSVDRTQYGTFSFYTAHTTLLWDELLVFFFIPHLFVFFLSLWYFFIYIWYESVLYIYCLFWIFPMYSLHQFLYVIQMNTKLSPEYISTRNIWLVCYCVLDLLFTHFEITFLFIFLNCFARIWHSIAPSSNRRLNMF